MYRGTARSFCIRHTFPKRQTDKTLKAHAVGDLILCLIVRQIKESLKNKYFEHHYNVKRRSARIAFPFFTQRIFKQRTECFKVDDFQLFKRIPKL